MNVYEIITDRIIEILEKDQVVPWKKPWRSTEGPRNLISKKPYRGINSFLLNCSPYESDYWLTYKQAKQKGGTVRKGQKANLVVFWKWINTVKEEDSDTETRLTKVPLLRYYNVFNLDQIDGINPPKEQEITSPFTPIEQAELIIQNMQNKPSIDYGGDRACYSPLHDSVKLPNRETFHSSEEFYSTAFHELSHATGHQSRVGRKGILEPSYFGSHDYSQEELVAEFGASMLCGVSGIEQSIIENSAAYIQGWLKVLKNDKKLLVLAAAQGQKSADFILNRQTDNQQDN